MLKSSCRRPRKRSYKIPLTAGCGYKVILEAENGKLEQTYKPEGTSRLERIVELDCSDLQGKSFPNISFCVFDFYQNIRKEGPRINDQKPA